jgi:hypothetical protein
MTSLTTDPLATLLERMFAAAEAPASSELSVALAELTPEQGTWLGTSTLEADYRTFYALAKDSHMAVSRDTASCFTCSCAPLAPGS